MVHHGMQVADDVPLTPPVPPSANSRVPLDSDGYITVPFAYGSMALWQGKRAPEFQTHRWHVYLRGEDAVPLPRIPCPLPSSFPRPRSKAPSSGEEQQHLQRETGTNFQPDPPLPIDFSLQAPRSQICSPLALIFLSVLASPSTAGQWSVVGGR